MYRFLLAIFFYISLFSTSPAQQVDIQGILQQHSKSVERASRKTIKPVLDALIDSKLEAVPKLLDNWRNKNLWLRKSDRRFFYLENAKLDVVNLIDIATAQHVGSEPRKNLKQLKPNSGVREIIAALLVRFQLISKQQDERLNALSSIQRKPNASHLAALRAILANEPNAQIKLKMIRLERLLTIKFATDPQKRIEAIESFSNDTDVDVRSALNQILQKSLQIAETLPDDKNIASRLRPGHDISHDEAFDLLVKKNLAPEMIDDQARNAILADNIQDGMVAGFPVYTLDNEETRHKAYKALENAGKAPRFLTEIERNKLLDGFVFFNQYHEPNKDVTDIAQDTINAINNRVDIYQYIDLGLDGLSLASIYFLAAIGLAITFGVMGVINMAHGEFIMIGAYTGYVVQKFVTDYTFSIIIALPLAFAVAFGAGVLLERLVIRHLMHRPLETLLATFGVSIALQQMAKNIFGTQARPLTAPEWLDGAWIVNDVISISYIRIAIFFLSLLFLLLLLFILKRTRLGLEVRAVTQNPAMASSMGINPDKINMLTFGLGSGIAGIAGVAIGLFAQVTSELGSGYIVQSFMTVVVGGVGNIWGTLAGAGMIGGLQKIIEWFNPSNTLAAQTYMIIFIIIFIQFRPKGIIALKGRAAGD